MRNITLCLAFFTLLASLCRAQPGKVMLDTTRATLENAQSATAIALATNFTKDLVKGAAAETLAGYCTVPFCHDDTALILTTGELTTWFQSLANGFAQSIQKNHPRFDSAYVSGVEAGVLFGFIPVNIYITVVNIKIHVRDQEFSKPIAFAIQMSDTGKIVGISK